MTKEFGLAATALVVAILATPAIADNDDYGGRGSRAGWYDNSGGRGWNGYGSYGGVGWGYRRPWDGGADGWGRGWGGYGGGHRYRRDDD